MQDRVGGGVHMVAAVGANVGATGGQLVMRAFLAASAALKTGAAKANGHDVLKAGIVIREASKDLADAELRGCGGLRFVLSPL